MVKANDFIFWRWRIYYAPLQTEETLRLTSRIHSNASSEKLNKPTQNTYSNIEEQEPLNLDDRILKDRKTAVLKRYILELGVLNVILLIAIVILAWRLRSKRTDPSLGVWSPANDAVEYLEHHFDAAFFTNTEYMGFPTDETDRMWTDLYDFGNTIISEEEAKKLHTPTLPIPGTRDYLVQLDIWHELHCLNDIRKVFYPERFTSLADITVDGKINRGSIQFRHWEHCIDALRQTLMCHADVAPIPFHINVPLNSGVFARIATTHTCRNFTKIQEWAKAHSAGSFNFRLSHEEAQSVIDTTEWDQNPEEDLEMFWPQFPGNLYFKHWREAARIIDSGA